ncbi:peroxiredoxin [Candidatus Uhrbacteria bacterium]|nr:peroxiredoxin [Candidatus Uhrbacteria bacterium]
MPTINQPAPDFKLPDQNGTPYTLSQYRGEYVLLYFYPKDDTPGCTKEACGIRDAFPDFQKLNIRVFGVSADSVASHKKFAEKYNLPFTLLADEKKEVIQQYEVTSRTSFLIDRDGLIKKIYEQVKPDTHATDVLADVRL